MLDTRTLNKCIKNIHDRALRLTFKDKGSIFKNVLEEDLRHSSKFHGLLSTGTLSTTNMETYLQNIGTCDLLISLTH